MGVGGEKAIDRLTKFVTLGQDALNQSRKGQSERDVERVSRAKLEEAACQLPEEHRADAAHLPDIGDRMSGRATCSTGRTEDGYVIRNLLIAVCIVWWRKFDHDLQSVR